MARCPHHAAERAAFRCAGRASAEAAGCGSGASPGSASKAVADAGCGGMVGRVGSRLVAELDLIDSREVLDVYSGWKSFAVPVEFRKRRVRADLKKSRDFPSGKGCIARVLSGALQEGLAVADGVSHLDLLRPLSPTAHWRPHPLCAAELALLNQEVNELGVGGGSGVMMALPRTETCFDCHQIVTLAGDRK